MEETNDILNSINKAMDTLNNVSRVTGDISTIGKSYKKRKMDKESGELDRINQEIIRYDKKGSRLIRCTLILWAALIIATIFLCITGNDVVLRFLHI